MTAESEHQPDPELIEPIEETADPATILERLNSVVEYLGGPKTLLASSIVASAAIAAVYQARKRGITIMTPEGSAISMSENQRAEHTISVVEVASDPIRAREAIAASMPDRPASVALLVEGADKTAVFGMSVRDGMDKPLWGDDRNVSGYAARVRTIAGWLSGFFSSIVNEPGRPE